MSFNHGCMYAGTTNGGNITATTVNNTTTSAESGANYNHLDDTTCRDIPKGGMLYGEYLMVSP